MDAQLPFQGFASCPLHPGQVLAGDLVYPGASFCVGGIPGPPVPMCSVLLPPAPCDSAAGSEPLRSGFKGSDILLNKQIKTQTKQRARWLQWAMGFALAQSLQSSPSGGGLGGVTGPVSSGNMLHKDTLVSGGTARRDSISQLLEPQAEQPGFEHARSEAWSLKMFYVSSCVTAGGGIASSAFWSLFLVYIYFQPCSRKRSGAPKGPHTRLEAEIA